MGLHAGPLAGGRVTPKSVLEADMAKQVFTDAWGLHYSAVMKADGAGGARVVVDPLSAGCVIAASMGTAGLQGIIAAEAAVKVLEHCQQAMIILTAEPNMVQLAAVVQSQGVCSRACRLRSPLASTM